MLDIELLARKPVGKANGCILATFNYRTRPEMKVVQEGYQRGPVHIGKFEMNLRVYGWDEEQVKKYKKMKDKENLFLMGEISASVQQAMESLGVELDRYLEEAEGMKIKESKKESLSEQKSLVEKFFGDFYTPQKVKEKIQKGPAIKELKKEQEETQKNMKVAVDEVRNTCWNMYKTFKKAHKMIMW